MISAVAGLDALVLGIMLMRQHITDEQQQHPVANNISAVYSHGMIRASDQMDARKTCMKASCQVQT